MLHTRAFGNHDLAVPRFGTGRYDVLARLNRALHRDAIARRCGVLHHHHGVGAQRDRCTSHDLDSFAPGNFELAGVRSSLKHAHAPQFGGHGLHVFGSHRIAISRGAGKGRKVAVSAQVLGQGQAEGIEQAS